MTRKLILALGAAALLAGCSSKPTSSSNPPPTASSTSPSVAPTPSVSLPPYHPAIDPAQFTDQVTNPYFPLPRGTTFIFNGTRDGVPRRDEVAVTKDIRVVMGVKCAVVRDVVTSGNALVEKTTDWYAQDTSGNVWYFGEDTKEYTNGAVSSTAGTWEAGVDNALPGIVMKAAPAIGDAYRQEYRPGMAEDFAKVQSLTSSLKIPTGSYSRVIVTEDTDLLDATKLEHKSYAPGVGLAYVEGVVNGHHEVTRLTQVLKTA